MVRYTLVNAKTISRKVTDKLVRAVDFGEGKRALTRKGEECLTLYTVSDLLKIVAFACFTSKIKLENKQKIHGTTLKLGSYFCWSPSSESNNDDFTCWLTTDVCQL